MSEWWTYRLEDFLLFAPRTYWRLIEAQNAALWPLPLATVGAGTALIALAARGVPRAGLWTGVVLGALWAFVGWSFLLGRYAGINWAVAYVAPAFFAQAALLVLAAVIPRGLRFETHGWAGRGGLLIAAAGVLLYPALAPLSGRSWASAELFGLAPDPTAVATAGFMLAAGGRWAAPLLSIPLLWCLLSAATLLAMGEGTAWVLYAVVALVIVLMAGRRAPPRR